MAAPPPVFSDLFDDATKWGEPVPDYDALILHLGGVASTAVGAPALYDRAQTMLGLANLAHRSPTLIAFCPADDNEYIYVGHSLSVYPSDPLVAFCPARIHLRWTLPLGLSYGSAQQPEL